MSQVADTVRRLRGSRRLALDELREIWEKCRSAEWAKNSHIHYLLADHILKAGEPLLAYDVLSKGREYHPSNSRIQRKLALALAESGAALRAHKIAQDLWSKGDRHSDTLGILARTQKDLALQARSARDRRTHLEESHRLYRRGYRLATDSGSLREASYMGVNAASTAALMDKWKAAKKIACEVTDISLRQMRRGIRKAEDKYWCLATLGEAALLSRRLAQAEEWYTAAADVGAKDYRSLSSTRRQARALLQRMREDPRSLDHCFPTPRIVVFAGHMIDRPGRRPPRFPSQLEGAVRQEIARQLRELDARIGYSSAACGSDIIFLEEMARRRRADRDIETHVMLPMPEDRFKELSVGGVTPRGDWDRRFDRVLKQASSSQVTAQEAKLGDPVHFEYSSMIICGRALLRASMLEAKLSPLVVWDGRPGDGPGGTTWIVERWRELGYKPVVIDINRIAQGVGAKPEPRPRGWSRGRRGERRATRSAVEQRIAAMLFADVRQFSTIPDYLIPQFVTHFLGTVRQEIDRSPSRLLATNTWGDGLFLVFPAVLDAGRFALDLCSSLEKVRWLRLGFAREITVRMALHAGPVYHNMDPVTNLGSFFGAHVTRTSRIEPVAPPGEVYASEPFAALAAVEAVSEFKCEYVGQTDLAKGYGTYPTYHVRRA